MIRRLSPRLGIYAVFASLLLLLGVLSSRLEPIALALPFLSALLLGLAQTGEPLLELSREVAGRGVHEGEATTVRIALRALADVPLLEVAGPVPEGAELLRGKARALFSLRRGEERTLTYAFRMSYRCHFELGPARARAHVSSGAATWETEAGGWVRCVVYPMPSHIRSRLRPPHTRSHAGSYPSRVAGDGIDFLGLRPFMSGDQTRRVNWRATARRGEVMVNQLAAERNADIVLVMDALSEAGPVGQSVLDVASRGAATLARELLRDRNRVGYLELGQFARWAFPAAGRRQWYRILDLLASLQVRERQLQMEIGSVHPRLLPPGSLVIGFGSLADTLWTRALVELKRRGHDVVIVALWAPEAIRGCIERGSLPDGPDTRLALRIWEIEQRATVSELERAGLPCVRWSPGEPFDLVLRAVDRAQRRAGR